MSHGRPAANLPEPSRTPSEGWHCTHINYQFDRGALAAMPSEQVGQGRDDVIAILNPAGEGAPQRLQTSIVSGHSADFALMLMDPDPLVIDSVLQKLASSAFGPALNATYSFVSITEISEYVPSVQQYSDRLLKEGETADSPSFNAKVKAYTDREPIMRRQRLTPDFPDWPAMCFYPMNKKRKVGENWFMLPVSERNALMSEHARSGMAYAGRVSQLISVGVGLDDWEWGVTLWARNPEFLTDIVYKMRFDEASARYAEFGPFFTSYIASAQAMLDHCRVGV